MPNLSELKTIKAMLTDVETLNSIDRIWDRVSNNFVQLDEMLPRKFMERRELSFHDHIKLLGILCLVNYDIIGDVVEIGTWKGKSISFIREFNPKSVQIIGIDPCEIRGQSDELTYFHHAAFPEAYIIKDYSHSAIESVVKLTKKIKLLHIDGGHTSADVWRDFLLYERFVVEGGFIVFDDYNDINFSPEVKPAVDSLLEQGLFVGYEVIGTLAPFTNSFVIRKTLNRES
jgi:hypothetical protein